MIIRRGGFSESGESSFETLLGDSDILAFRYDSEESRFSVVSGRERAFLGYSRVDWLTAGFLENILSGEDRLSILSLMRNCYSGQQIVRDCMLMNADSADCSAVIAAIASESDPTKISGQIIVLDPGVVLTRRHVDHQAMNIQLMRSLTTVLSQCTCSLAGFSDLLVRHLGARNDDVGGEFAIGIQDAIATLTSTMEQLRQLSTGNLSVSEISSISDALLALHRKDLNGAHGVE